MKEFYLIVSIIFVFKIFICCKLFGSYSFIRDVLLLYTYFQICNPLNYIQDGSDFTMKPGVRERTFKNK